MSSDSVGNIFTRDQARFNTIFDVVDNSVGTSNIYRNIVCETDNKDGSICGSHLRPKKPKSKTALHSKGITNSLSIYVD